MTSKRTLRSDHGDDGEGDVRSMGGRGAEEEGGEGGGGCVLLYFVMVLTTVAVGTLQLILSESLCSQCVHACTEVSGVRCYLR